MASVKTTTRKNPFLYSVGSLINVLLRYRHLITGSSSDKPDDIPGGLLADAMGVGKTLTMIASIASSMENANLFVSNETTGSSPDMHWRCPINSTLILVPSACTLPNPLPQLYLLT